MSRIYRKKPVVVEAMQFTGDNFDAAVVFTKGKFLVTRRCGGRNEGYAIVTLEGPMTVCEGDYIIKGVKGEFYACTPDIFEQTYEDAAFEPRYVETTSGPQPLRTVDILGVKWSIHERSESEDKRLEGCDGYSDWTTKEIAVEREVTGTLGDMEAYIRKVLRHEIVHAFLLESGLHEASAPTDAWATNEEMVDWFARMGQRIYQAWETVGALDGGAGNV